MAGPLDFWKLVKEVNPKGIREESARPFQVAAVGHPDELPVLRHIVGLDDPAALSFADGHWVEVTLPLSAEARRDVSRCAFALSISESVGDVPVVTWNLPADQALVEKDVAEIMARFPHLALALPRFLPVFRHEGTDRVIAATARANTEIALASSLPGVLPWTAALLPATAFPDMLLLTKNQVMMCLRIAAMYGLPIEPKARIAELGGIVGAAFGWRALARELIGAVPGGVGAGLKGAISYAGTVATGRAAQAFYETGRRLTDAERRSAYDEALDRGRSVSRDLWDRLRRRSPEGAAA